MTTPTPAPAMTAKRLAEIARAITPYPGKELFAYIDALTARVAELERERDARGEEFATALAGLQSELAAARKVEDEEVKRWVSNLQAAGGNQGTFTESERLRYRTLADLLTRLSTALKEAERVKSAALEEATHARNAAVVARRDALEEAAARCDAIAQKVFEIRMLSEDMRGFDIQPAGCAAAIRTLQTKDTTP